MARPLRIEFPGATYHVMSRGVDGTATFIDDQDRCQFLDLVRRPQEKGALIVHAFALMTNHYHILAETPQGGLGRIMQGILGEHARRFNLSHDRVGHLWQARYKAILVEDGDYFLECSRYIHLNPRRANLARSAERYRWSSYRNYVGGSPAVNWVSTRRTLDYFESAMDYRDFVGSGRGEEQASPFERATAGLVLGGELFVQRMRRLALQERVSEYDLQGLGRLRRRGHSPTAEAVHRAVSSIFPHLSPCQRKRVLMFALDRCTWMKRVEIAKEVERSPGAVTTAVCDVSRRMSVDGDLAGRFGRLLERLHQPASEILETGVPITEGSAESDS